MALDKPQELGMISQSIHLMEWNIRQSKANNSLFFLAKGTDILFALIYVDDKVITGNNDQQLQEFIDRLNFTFVLKDMGKLKQFLRIEVQRNSTSLHLKQTRYTIELIKIFGYEDLKPSLTSMAVGKLVSKTEGQTMKDPILYRSAVGGLQYLIHTRLDFNLLCKQVKPIPSNTN